MCVGIYVHIYMYTFVCVFIWYTKEGFLYVAKASYAE